jgi:flagellar export protein FliJ
MSALESLIRVHRWQLDERRRYLSGLDALAERLRADALRVEEEARGEARAAGLFPEAGRTYPLFIRVLIERRRKIERSIAEVEAQIEEAREAVSEAFREVKRYELAAANRARDAQSRVARRQRREEDALAIDLHRRKSEA